MSRNNQTNLQANLNTGKPQPLPKHIVVSGQRINLHQWKAKNVRDSILLGIFTIVMLIEFPSFAWVKTKQNVQPMILLQIQLR